MQKIIACELMKKIQSRIVNRYWIVLKSCFIQKIQHHVDEEIYDADARVYIEKVMGGKILAWIRGVLLMHTVCFLFLRLASVARETLHRRRTHRKCFRRFSS
jgi:hypothetical protein